MWVEVLDRNGNPLSNMAVDWEVREAERVENISEPLPDVFQNARIRSQDGDEFLDEDRRLTGYFGELVYARLGDQAYRALRGEAGLVISWG